MLRSYRDKLPTLAGLKKRPSLGIIPAASAALVIYYAFADAGYVPYAKVCAKGDYGPPDQCAFYDVVTARVLQALVFLDQHNGAVAAGAGLAVAGFTYFLWLSTEKLWAAGEKTAEDNRISGQTQADKMEKSIDAMRDANDIARDIGQAQVRCYLSIKSVFATVNSLGMSDIAVTLSNTGQSPARKFFWASEMTYMTGKGEVYWESDKRPIDEGDHPRDIPIGNIGGFGRSHIGRLLSEEEGVALRESDTIIFTAEITIRWEDVFGTEFNETHKFQGGAKKPYIGVPVALQPTFPIKIEVVAT